MDFSKRTAAQEVRDGLLVLASDEVLGSLLTALDAFHRRGGAFGVHVGDVACGGKTFQQPRGEFEEALRRYTQLLRAKLAGWPVYHLPGNHDVTPGPAGGMSDWHHIVGESLPGGTAAGGSTYREVLQPGWQILLLDSMDGLTLDRGGGQLGEAQIRWLEAKLGESASAGRSVILLTHQARSEGGGRERADCGWVRVWVRVCGGICAEEVVCTHRAGTAAVECKGARCRVRER